MRKEFAEAIIQNVSRKEHQVFITGDLGYMALEEVRNTFTNRFINAGVAEQNMVSVAAGMAKEGFIPWVYSIAPFVTLRPYEQLRNDVCLHNLPVKLVGNGGGFGYGIMGATHHNPEDIGVMRLLPHLRIYIPFLAKDVSSAVQQILDNGAPSYLRLNLPAKIPVTIPDFQCWRKIQSGNKAIVIGTGPVLANLFEFPELIAHTEIWVLGIFPHEPFPKELLESLQTAKIIITIEEHYGAGGLGECLAKEFLGLSIWPKAFHSLHATPYPSGKYGSQRWHLEENNLAGESLYKKLEPILR